MTKTTKTITRKTATIAISSAMPVIDRLAFRWEDEHEYENINDYAAPLKKALQDSIVIERMVGSPHFGFDFRAGTHRGRFRYRDNFPIEWI